MSEFPSSRKSLYFVGISIALAAAATLLSTSSRAARRPASVRPDRELNLKAQTLAEQGKTAEAQKILSDSIAKETDKSKRALARLSLAVIEMRASRDAEAETQFSAAITDGLRVPEYAYHYRGLLKKKTGRLKEAADDFKKVIALKPARATEVDARFELADVFLSQQDYKSAQKEFASLRKKTRSSERYPDVLLGLYRAEKKLGGKDAGCKAARELYSKFPTHSAIRAWGPALEKNELDSQKVVCRADVKDLKVRARRLQLGGEAERAAKELQEIKDGKGDDDAYAVDSMLATHLISEGETENALKLLMKHYESQKTSPTYLSLLGKAAARAGEYQAAIAAYQKAFELAPRAKDSSSALFQAGFTAYQIQDYDGATRRFSQLIKAFPNSKVARDAKWHLAWMRYLRGDYQGALESFEQLAKAPAPRRSRRRSAPVETVQADRLKYWSAMSLVKLGRTQEATTLFQALVRDPAIGYYSVLSFYRILAIPGAKFPTGIETRLGLKKSEGAGAAAPSEEEMKIAAEAIEDAAAEYDTEVAADDEAEDIEEVAPVQVAEENAFSNATLAQRFERARDLAFVGLRDPARRELGEIELRARRSEDRKLLMTEYAQVENYYRSSYIGDLGFGPQRLRGGLRGESRLYWESAYPKAWSPAVTQSSRATSVPEELIWGIMRAESHYRSDAHSPVGALGLMQIMPFTGRQVASLLSINSFEAKSLLEPEVNIRLGSRYLQRLLEKFSGSIPLVAAGYNAGPHRVHAWVRNFGTLDMDEFVEHIPFIETRNYVKKVVRNYQIYSLLYSGGGHSLRWLIQPVGVRVDDRVPTREVW